MTSIRYRHNYSLVTITPEGELYKSTVTGNTIPALKKNGERFFAPYKGSIDYKYIDRFQRVKLVGITSWTLDSQGLTGWEDIPKNSYVVGVYINEGYFIVLCNKEPVVYGLS